MFRKVSLLAFALLLSPMVVHGATVTLAWDANTEDDLAGYKIHYGTASHSYSQNIDVGDVTEYTLEDLDDGVTYYLAATAYDVDKNESGYSEELVHTFSVGEPTVGHNDYCRDAGPCAAGEGDCDNDSECEAGLICDQVLGTDTCKEPVSCKLTEGHLDYCRECGPCAAGQGDCDINSECESGLTCVQVLAPHERDPTADGPVRLVDAESGRTLDLDVDAAALRRYRVAFDGWVRSIAAYLRSKESRHLLLDTSMTADDRLLQRLRESGVLL